MMFSVLLVPEIELHRGIHGSLTEHPPPAVCYGRAECVHEYLLDASFEGCFDPLSHYALGEVLHIASKSSGRALVHSRRVPVYGNRPWIADADCFLATLLYGRDFIFGSAGTVNRSTCGASLVRRRMRVMLEHFLDASCLGLLFNSDYRRSLFLEAIEDEGILDPMEFDRLQQRCDVVRPTLPVRIASFEIPTRPRVVYMGRVLNGKGGDVAAEVFRLFATASREAVDLCWVGEPPQPGWRLPASIRILPSMNRSTYLELLQAGHIFFSPTCSEGYGMGLVEAACSGMAVVSTCGTGMEHISEVFETGRNAYLVENSLPFDQKIRAFHQIISMLLEDSQERERLARNCLELTTRGRLSVGCRNEKLLTYYQRMLEGYDAIAAEGEARMGEIRMRNGLISRCFPEKELHSRYRRHSAGTERRVWVT